MYRIYYQQIDYEHNGKEGYTASSVNTDYLEHQSVEQLLVNVREFINQQAILQARLVVGRIDDASVDYCVSQFQNGNTTFGDCTQYDFITPVLKLDDSVINMQLPNYEQSLISHILSNLYERRRVIESKLTTQSHKDRSQRLAIYLELQKEFGNATSNEFNSGYRKANN